MCVEGGGGGGACMTQHMNQGQTFHEKISSISVPVASLSASAQLFASLPDNEVTSVVQSLASIKFIDGMAYDKAITCKPFVRKCSGLEAVITNLPSAFPACRKKAGKAEDKAS